MHRTLVIFTLLLLAVAPSLSAANGATVPATPAAPGAGPMDADEMQPDQQMQDQHGMTMDQGRAMGAMEGAGPDMMGMGSAMTVDGQYLYIMRGNQLIKLDKNTMQVISTTTLPATNGSNAMTTPPQATAQPATTGGGPAYQICEPAPGIPSGAGPSQSAQTLANNICSMDVCESEPAYLNAMIENQNAQFAWSQLAAEKATRANLRRFANRIVDESPSITNRFSRQLGDWYQVRSTRNLAPEDTQILNTLQNLQGRDFDVAYMQAMLSQLQGSMIMSRNIASRSTRSELVQTANSVANNDALRIQQLRTWLSEWYGITPS